MKNRIELAKYFNELGFKVGAEIGVCDGYYSEILCQIIPNLKLYCIDAWRPYAKYRDYTRQLTFDNMIKMAKERLSKFDCILIKKWSMDAVKDFDDETLDFVYIDANHNYEFVKEDIREWSKKVRKGGIISGHDYYITPKKNKGVVDAVDEYVKENGVKLELTGWDKGNPVRDDKQPSWYFTKL